jgi:agmatine deiminase
VRIIDFVLEGGSIEVNGAGTLITSRSCLLNPNRNSSYTQNQIEDVLRENLGVRKIIWVEEGIAGDDTDGHIDDTVRFVAEDTVVCAYEPNVADANHLPLLKIYNSLTQATLADGRPLRVIKLPMPPHLAYEGQRVPASHANFLIINEKVLVPIYHCPEDKIALNIFQEYFPTRRVVGVDCREVVWGLGAIHCLSQNIPARSKTK